MTQPTATVIAAILGVLGTLIGVIGTLLVTRFEDITTIIRKPSRKISGTWEGRSYEISYGQEVTGEPPTIQHQPSQLNEYTLTIKQRGEKFEAKMKETKVYKVNKLDRHEKLEYTWKGKIFKDYIVYESICNDSNTFLRSTAMLFIDAQGQKMSGYFVATSSTTAPLRTWVGFAILIKKM